ncbi:MAG: diguanylate cyclase [Gammaproteobacteria bacterium]|nr:diguanylate cyclase [Gammaproteobacteria bacterium]
MNKTTTYFFSFLLGTLLLIIFATIQKIAFGIPLVAVGYIIPASFGGITGLLFGIWMQQLREAHNKLQHLNTQLEQNVSQSSRGLIESNNKLNLMLESINEGIYGVDSNGCCTFINRAALETLGYQDKSQLLGKKIHQLIHRCNTNDSYYDEADCPLYQAWKQDKSISLDGEVLWRKDGSQFIAKYRSFPLNDEDVVDNAVVTFSDITERKRIEGVLITSEKQSSALLEAIPDSIFRINREGDILYFQADSHDLFASPETIIGKSSREILPDEVVENINHNIRTTLETGEMQTFEYQLSMHDNNIVDYEARMVKSDKDEVTAIVRDISEHKLAEALLLESEEKFRSTFQTAVVGMVVVIEDKEIISEWNTGAEQIFGYSASEVVGKSLTMIMPERFRKAHLKGFTRAVEQKRLAHTGVTHELVGLRKNGDEFPLTLTLGSWKKNGKFHVSAIILDISERKHAEARLQHLATHDPLTGLFNRNVLEQRTIDEIRRAKRYRRSLSVFMLDLDHFKLVNDNHGHQTGDTVLASLARTLERSMRETDLVARYGGEEFVILLPETTLLDAKELAERLCRHIAKHPIAIADDTFLNITASIGVSTFPEHAESGLDLINAADTAMYAAKDAGRNCVMTAKTTT